jgi:DNA-binding transcriptional LysR family regulator
MEYLIEVADTGSFARAAENLHVSQPGLSQQIRQLERDVGTPLLARRPRNVVPTAAGRAYLADARVAVNAARNAKRAARNLASGHGGDLEIATVRSLSSGVLPRSLTRWHREYPDVVVRLHEFGNAHTMEEQVADGLADLAVGPTPTRWDGPVMELGKEEYVVVLPRNDPLLEPGGELDLCTLSGRDWVLYDRANGLSVVTETICHNAGFIPRGAVHTTQISAGVAMAVAGLGPMLVPSHAIPAGMENTVMRLREPFHRTLAVYARSAFNPTALAYAKLLRDTKNKLKPS